MRNEIKFPKSTAPWTEKEVESLNNFQRSGTFHQFTCGNCSESLVADPSGWNCPECKSYSQNWAYLFMVDGDWMQFVIPFGVIEQEE